MFGFFITSLYATEKGGYDKKILRNAHSFHLPMVNKVLFLNFNF